MPASFTSRFHTRPAARPSLGRKSRGGHHLPWRSNDSNRRHGRDHRYRRRGRRDLHLHLLARDDAGWDRDQHRRQRPLRPVRVHPGKAHEPVKGLCRGKIEGRGAYCICMPGPRPGGTVIVTVVGAVVGTAATATGCVGIGCAIIPA